MESLARTNPLLTPLWKRVGDMCSPIPRKQLGFALEGMWLWIKDGTLGFSFLVWESQRQIDILDHTQGKYNRKTVQEP